jgi:hypothetical protein
MQTLEQKDSVGKRLCSSLGLLAISPLILGLIGLFMFSTIFSVQKGLGIEVVSRSTVFQGMYYSAHIFLDSFLLIALAGLLYALAVLLRKLVQNIVSATKLLR